MIKVMFVIGTRPEAIKMASVIMECKKYSNAILSIVIAVSQHESLLSQALEMFNITPNYNLHVMKKGQTLFNLHSRILQKIEPLFEKINPNIVLVQGDTTTAFVSALAAYYKKIDIGHIEAGIRSFNKYDPFPEEINRKLIDSISDFHFAPTKISRENLIKEGIDRNTISITGNTIVDTLYFILKRKWKNNLKQVNWRKKIILVTLHRRESFGHTLSQIADALNLIANKNKDIEIIFPIHPNPNVKNVMEKTLDKTENIKIFEPFDYITFVNIMKKSFLILTDSGGVQEEAPYLGIPTFVLRNLTDRPESIKTGFTKVIGTQSENIIKNVQIFLDSKDLPKGIGRKFINPYGDGKASEKIIKVIVEKYS